MKLIVKMDIYIVLKKIDEIQEMLITERVKRNTLSLNITKELMILV